MKFFEIYGDRLISATQTHLFYVFVSVGIGLIVALILGILLSRIPQYAKIIMPILSVFQTIPGIVFIGLLFLILGMVPITVITALSIYAVFPILKNTYTGLLDVDPALIEAAKGMGMTQIDRLLSVEIPLAFPMIFTGIRIATITTIGAAIFATSVGGGGLGSIIYQGIRTQNMRLILFGTSPLMIMAIFFDILMSWINNRMDT